MFFERNGNAFAYGIVVTFYDRNRDEVFDIQTEPIIGFNQVSGVCGASCRCRRGHRLSRGYHLYNFTIVAIQNLSADPLEATPDSTTLSISGTTMALSTSYPISAVMEIMNGSILSGADVWGSLSKYCEPLEELCAFCLGQSKTVNPTAAEGPLDVSDDEALEEGRRERGWPNLLRRLRRHGTRRRPSL